MRHLVSINENIIIKPTINAYYMSATIGLYCQPLQIQRDGDEGKPKLPTKKNFGFGQILWVNFFKEHPQKVAMPLYINSNDIDNNHKRKHPKLI